MMEDQDYLNDENENREEGTSGVNKVLAYLFVIAIYLVIFLKILFIK